MFVCVQVRKKPNAAPPQKIQCDTSGHKHTVKYIQVSQEDALILIASGADLTAMKELHDFLIWALPGTPSVVYDGHLEFNVIKGLPPMDDGDDGDAEPESPEPGIQKTNKAEIIYA